MRYAGILNDYEYRNVRGHIEVYLHGEFIVSADNLSEAIKEVRAYENPCLLKYHCGWYDSDLGCTCPSLEHWYQCPMEPEPDWDAIMKEDEERGRYESENESQAAE